MRGKLVIAGASGHAMVVADIVRLSGEYEIVGFLDDDEERHNTRFCGLPIVGSCRQLDRLWGQGIDYLLVAIGHCPARWEIARLGQRAGFRLATAIHPRAVIAAGVTIGGGTVVAAGAVVNPGAVLGENVIINTCASVDHECQVGDGAHISPGAHLAGRVEVGDMTWVGAGATVRDGVRLGQGSIIGAGAVVLRDIPDGVVAYGVPARVRRNTGGDPASAEALPAMVARSTPALKRAAPARTMAARLQRRDGG